jgi:hypothetical protein
MRLTIESDCETIDFFKELELLTNAAQVTAASIVIDEAKNEITIPMKRRSYKRQRFLFIGERYKLQSPDLIESRLIVKQVVAHEQEDNLHLPEIHILFGVNVKDKEISLCSAEEQSGVTAFRMSIKVTKYDIELSDEGPMV